LHRIYSCSHDAKDCDVNGMPKKHPKPGAPIDSLKNVSARQRWELFHRAIAYAKQSNDAAIAEQDPPSSDPEKPLPVLSVVR